MKLAEAYRLPGYRVFSEKEAFSTIKEVRKTKGPTLIEFVVDQHDMVYPMVPAGANLDAMIRRPKNINSSLNKNSKLLEKESQ